MAPRDKSPSGTLANGEAAAGSARDRVMWVVLASAIALMPWVYSPWHPTRETLVDFKWPVVAVATILVLGASFLQRMGGGGAKKGPLFPAPPAIFLWSGGAIIAGLVLSSSFSPAPALGFRTTLRETMFLALALRLASFRPQARDLRLIFGAYIGSAALQAALTLVQWAFAVRAGESARAAMFGTIGNPEYLAGWIAPAFVASVMALVAIPMKPAARWAHAIAAGVMGVSIVASGGRGAALGVLVSLLVLGILARRRGRLEARGEQNDSGLISKRQTKPLIAIGGLIALALIVLGIAFGPDARRSSLVGRAVETFDPYSISIRHRVGLIIVTSEMIADRPLVGHGPGRFGAAFARARGKLARESSDVGAWVYNDIVNEQPVNEAHSDPLQWWAEYGLAPVMGLIALMAWTMAGLGRAVVKSPDPAPDALVLAAFVALAVGMLFAFPLHRPARALLFWALVGMAGARGARGQEEN